MATHQTIVEQITAVQWTGSNLAAVQAVAPEAFERDGALYIPSSTQPIRNMNVALSDWVYYKDADTPPRFIYVEPPQTFMDKWVAIP